VSFDVGEGADWLDGVSPGEMRRIVDALYRVHALHAKITDLDGVLESIMEESKAVASAEACSLLLFDEYTQELYFHVALGESGDQDALKQQVRLKLDQGIAGIAASMQESVNVPDAKNDPRVHSEADDIAHFETRSILAVPLVDDGSLVGVLEVLNKVDDVMFTEVDQRIMEMFSSLVASLITRARLVEENIRSERLAAIGQAVAGLSHYIKNILNTMDAGVSVVDEEIRDEKYAGLLEHWPILMRSTERLSNVVEDMMAFSKSRKPHRESVSVEELLADAVAGLKALLSREAIQINVENTLGDTQVKVDPHGIYRCLLNLLTNAVDALPESGGTLMLRVYPMDGGTFGIEVIDNGPGIPERDRERVFDPFYSTKGSRGTGLGLAVTRKIVQEHSGTVSLSPAGHGGTAARIVLPL
jgi:signal transduction histidine kinase